MEENQTKLSSADYYYDPQSRLSTHDSILSDTETIQTYKEWIENNKELIKDKVVLEIGCGTGLLSLLAARAGAGRVIGVEWSAMADYAAQIVRRNCYHFKVCIMKCRVEDIIRFPWNIEKVDIIISLWMGISLVQGDRLEALIYARNKWLKPNGLIMPDKATLFICGLSDPDYQKENIDWWNNVYGYNMSPAIDSSIKEANHAYISPKTISTNVCKLKDIDLLHHSFEQIMKFSFFKITATRDSDLMGFLIYFSVRFSADKDHTLITNHPMMKPKFLGPMSHYIKNSIAMKRKELVYGSVHFQNLDYNCRILQTTIGYYFRNKTKKEVKDSQVYMYRT